MTSTRAQWLRRLFPDGVPRLWCPPLTHYDSQGQIDENRIRAHVRFLSPWVKALLVPGSTGDGWELTPAERARVVEIALATAPALQQRVLLGALHPESTEACRIIQFSARHFELDAKSGEESDSWLERDAVCGFAVCPPRGERLSQEAIGNQLRQILQLGLPVALYQLPQITRNEMSSALVEQLAEQFPNFVLFKDTSGHDTVATSGRDFGGVFLVRGMEGEYAQWLRSAGGPYDGFLLSAANYFARELAEMIELITAGRASEAAGLSDRVSRVVTEVFALAQDVPDGNVFANAGKAIDHFFAHGPSADKAPPPRLHSGRTLPVELLRASGESLRRSGLMPVRGYLD